VKSRGEPEHFRPGHDVNLMQVHQTAAEPGAELLDDEDRAELLDDEDRAAIALIADRLLERLQPGLGPMLIPGPVAAAAAAYPNYVSQWAITPGYDDLRMTSRCQADGSIALELAWQGRQRVWAGVLRPASPLQVPKPSP
jgi:hypothetical protein